MRTLGVDLGSRTVKVVLLADGQVAHQAVREASFDPWRVCQELMAGLKFERAVATGYGRHLFQRQMGGEVVSEIRAVSEGANRLFEGCTTVLDIGGQDTKVVSLDERGRVRKFEMNDKCAAGTGRFLEVMAQALGFTMEEFVSAALAADRGERVSSMCTVFAESEVVGMVARGVGREELALGIHRAVAERAAAMVKRVGGGGEVVFCGGAAYNLCLLRLLEELVARPLRLPPQPQTVAALGCAWLAAAADGGALDRPGASPEGPGAPSGGKERVP